MERWCTVPAGMRREMIGAPDDLEALLAVVTCKAMRAMTGLQCTLGCSADALNERRQVRAVNWL